MAATGSPLPWPAPESLALKFIAHHLWDPAQKAIDSLHGMPADLAKCLADQGNLRIDGPHAPGTVKRRLAHWATLHRWRGLDGPFGSPSLRTALRLSVRASSRPLQRKSRRAVTSDILNALIAVCAGARLADTRDKALLLTAFASGGRRRSEIARLRFEQLADEEPVPADPGNGDGPSLPCVSIALGRTKTRTAGEGARVLLVGSPVIALREWLERADIVKGPIFRAIDRWGAIEERALTPQAVNLILKRRCIQAGLDPRDYSAHGLRSGYLTEAASQGVPLPEAMQQSQHRSVQQAARYYNTSERRLGKAARLAG